MSLRLRLVACEPDRLPYDTSVGKLLTAIVDCQEWRELRKWQWREQRRLQASAKRYPVLYTEAQELVATHPSLEMWAFEMWNRDQAADMAHALCPDWRPHLARFQEALRLEAPPLGRAVFGQEPFGVDGPFGYPYRVTSPAAAEAALPVLRAFDRGAASELVEPGRRDPAGQLASKVQKLAFFYEKVVAHRLGVLHEFV